MFSSSSLDKNCIDSDSCSPSRNNAPNRFSVGIAPLGDENQHIRIQLAVHKYNGTTGSPFSNRCSFMSPIRHSFLKNSLKVRNCEEDHEGSSKTDKRNGNQYEGVGAFPTVHLKKNALRYRPIKRFHDVKIPYPELPVNRFLSHLPEVCPDLKSSTRSVLDVLEDLSGNKIHPKDENGCSKPKSQGLGGDYLPNRNAVFKPLFVQKPKLSTVLTRDSTTQTLSPVSLETPSPQSTTSSHVRNGPPDPRAELRRKLAKQNNEIFASLSSSISSGFCLKRKIDKVWSSKDDGQSAEGSALKRTKTSDHHSSESNQNGAVKSVINSSVNSSESVKSSRKSKYSDANSVSPNKDRLTTIFLDTRSTSPRARVFQASASDERASEGGSRAETNGEPVDKAEAPLANGNSESTDGSGKSASSGPDKQQMEQAAVVSSNSGTKGTALSNSADSAPKTVVGNVSFPSEANKSGERGNGLEKKENGGKDMSGGFTFGKSDEKPAFGSFKFGLDAKGSTAEPASTASVVAFSSATQFSLSTAPSVTASALQTPAFQFGMPNSQSTFASLGNSAFTFGHTTSPSQQTSTSTDGKLATSSTPPASSTITAIQSTQPVTFTFGQKPSDSSAPTVVSQSAAVSPSKSSGERIAPVFATEQKPETSVISGGPAPAAQEQTKTFPFVFGQKEKEVESEQKRAQLSTQASAASTSTQMKQTFGQTVSAATSTTAPQVTFTPNSASQTSTTFGAKLEGGSVNGLPSSGFNPSNSLFPNKTFSFGSSGNPFSKTTTQTTAAFATSTSSGPAFGFQIPTTTTSSVHTFGVSSATQSAPTFGTSSTTQSAPTFGTSSTTQSAPTFGTSSTTQSAPTFGTSLTAQSAPTLVSSSTAQSAPTFGTSSATQSAPAFGTSLTAQSAPTLVSSSMAQSAASFGTSSATQSAPTFVFSSATQSAPTFGSSSTSQSAPTFGSSSTSQSAPTFGSSSTSQSAPSFGSTSATQSISAFPSAAAAQTTPAFGTSPSPSTSAFTAPPATQPPPAFGASSAPHSAPHSTPTFMSSTKQSLPSFGTTSTTQSTPSFPIASSQPSLPFATSTPFGLSSSQTTPVFGAPTSTQSPITFKPPTTQTNPTFPPSAGFANPFSTPPTAPFPTSPPASAAAASPTSSNIFAQNPSPAFSSPSVFTSNQSNIFARKSATEATVFGQNKGQTPAFGSASTVFGSQNKFSFGMSTSSGTAFTASPPTTTAPLLYNFGATAPSSTFAFAPNASSSNAPFAFTTPSNEPFKFGATTTAAATTTSTTTEGGARVGFGGAAPPSFSFASPAAEQKATFNFGGAASSSGAGGFNFGSTPSPSVFNFGGSSSSGSSGGSFNFGAGFGQTGSPGAAFAVPGTFNIGSGSSQSRPRASSRPRRRP